MRNRPARTIEYQVGPGPFPGEGRTPDGDWIRLIPFALGFPRIVESVRTQARDGFVHLDETYDLKLFGHADLFGSGPNLIVSDDFVRAFRSAGLEGLELAEVVHATPLPLRVRPPWWCRPTHHATAVSDRVALVPPTSPRGLPYGYHGRPTEPLELRAPPVPKHVAFGAPWFATGSKPFQPLVVPSRFLTSFRQTCGREPWLGWTDCRLVEDTGQALLPRTERFGSPVPAASRQAGYASFDDALAAARRETTGLHEIAPGSTRPSRVAGALCRELGVVAGSVFYRGAFGLFPAKDAERAAVSPSWITARNVPEPGVTLGDAGARASYVELGYPLADDWAVVGWFASDFPSLVAMTPEGEVRRVEANGERNLRYPSFADFFADVMADLDWAHRHGRYGPQWFGL